MTCSSAKHTRRTEGLTRPHPASGRGGAGHVQPHPAVRQDGAGFVALISAILIAVGLLTLVTAAGFSGFFTRFVILDSEIKKRSAFLAEACVNTAMLKVSQGASQETDYSGDEFITVGSSTCRIVSVEPPEHDAWPKTIRAVGTSSGAYGGVAHTNLEVEVVDGASVTIESWEEVPEF